MNQSDLQKRANRLKCRLEMLSVLPEESPEGKLRDAFWQGALESELKAVEQQLEICRGELAPNALLYIIRRFNELRRLKNVQLI